MMCPAQDTPPETLGRKITIAWNGSTEAARAVALTLDLLAAADEVVILTSGAAADTGNNAENLSDYLAMRGITATIDRFKSRGIAGDTLIELTKKHAADIMIMGAYGDSHERETLFGGNTQSVVDHSTIPVILVH